MKILLHICCGVCAAGVVERLILEGHQVHGLFYNPNIHPRQEYDRRLEVALKVAKELDFPLEVPLYITEEWFNETVSLENEPEGGRQRLLYLWPPLHNPLLCSPPLSDHHGKHKIARVSTALQLLRSDQQHQRKTNVA